MRRLSGLVAWLGRPLVADVDHPIGVGRAYVEVLAVYSAFLAAGVVNALLLLARPVVGVLCERRRVSAADLGLSPGASLSPSIAGVSRQEAWTGTVGLAALGHMLFGEVIDLIGSGGYPFGTLDAAYLVEQLVRSVNAGIVEESVLVAFVMVTLAQAKRPLWEIAAVTILLRGLFDLYYGPGALGVVLWVPLAMWVFWRGRSLYPLIAVHALWDIKGFLAWYKVPVSSRSVLCWR